MRFLLIVVSFCLIFVTITLQAEEVRHMPLALHDVQDKICRVENGLTPAIRVAGEPLLRQNIESKMKEMNVPGVSIAVINNGQIEWAKAYGVLSSKQSRNTDIETCFQAGSVSKPVAAYAILSLVNQGILDLDQDVNDYLNSWKIPDNEYTAINKVTLRHLLSHTSGCTVIGFDGYTQGEQLPTITQTLDGIKPANNSPVRVEFIPGSRMSYSGGGYNIAQQVIEDVTKIPFSQFADSILLKPLKMNRSTFGIISNDTQENIAFAHPTRGLPMNGGWKAYPESAAAGLWTTPLDLANWLIVIQNGLTTKGGSQTLNHDLLIDMVTPQVAVHGLGPVVNGERNQLEISFKGRTDGFTCGFISFPYLRQGAVVMINAGNELGFIDAVLRSIAHEYQWPTYQVAIKKVVMLASETLDRYVGRYGWGETANDIYDLFVFKENDQLYWKIGLNANPSKLYAEQEDYFFSADTGYDIVFAYQDNNISKLTIIVQKGFERDFKKICNTR